MFWGFPSQFLTLDFPNNNWLWTHGEVRMLILFFYKNIGFKYQNALLFLFVQDKNMGQIICAQEKIKIKVLKEIS